MNYKLQFALFSSTLLIAASSDTKLAQADAGAVTFESTTNMPGIEVKGKSNSLSARVEISREANKLVLHEIEASVPVKTLATGMKIRDEHMRQYIFRNGSGAEPDLRFVSDQGVCEGPGGAKEFSCQISGKFSVQGIDKPLTLTLKVKEQGPQGDSFKAAGDAVLKLSTYGITPPSQFGVKPADAVKIHFDFTVKAHAVTASRGPQ